jgi:DNA-binding GntR family transcriptional regulator
MGMGPKRAVEIIEMLAAIECELARFYAGAEADEVIAALDLKISELRDALWHEMPREFARIMDAEDGLPAARGEWP